MRQLRSEISKYQEFFNFMLRNTDIEQNYLMNTGITMLHGPAI